MKKKIFNILNKISDSLKPLEHSQVENSHSFVNHSKNELTIIQLNHQMKNRLLTRIDHIVLQAEFQAVPDQIKDICEIVHYSCIHDTPVKFKYLKVIIPDLELSDLNTTPEYEEYLKSKDPNMQNDEIGIKIDDPHNIRDKNFRGRNMSGNQQSMKDTWEKRN